MVAVAVCQEETSGGETDSSGVETEEEEGPDPETGQQLGHGEVGNQADGGDENGEDCWEVGSAAVVNSVSVVCGALVLRVQKLEKKFLGVSIPRAVL